MKPIVTFGEIMCRLAAPGHLRLRQTRELEVTYAVTDASVHDSQILEPLQDGTEGEVYADSAYRSAGAEAMLAAKQVASQVHERAYRNRRLSEEQEERNRQKSKVRARIEHV